MSKPSKPGTTGYTATDDLWKFRSAGYTATDDLWVKAPKTTGYTATDDLWK